MCVGMVPKGSNFESHWAIIVQYFSSQDGLPQCQTEGCSNLARFSNRCINSFSHSLDISDHFSYPENLETLEGKKKLGLKLKSSTICASKAKSNSVKLLFVKFCLPPTPALLRVTFLLNNLHPHLA